jgi:hypothetical protein
MMLNKQQNSAKDKENLVIRLLKKGRITVEIAKRQPCPFNRIQTIFYIAFVVVEVDDAEAVINAYT